jgi:hypothetical protein
LKNIYHENKLFAILKLSFVTFLFLLFLIFFGLPSFELYLKKGILVSESTDISVDDTIAPPALTVCAQNKESDFGWKKNLLSSDMNPTFSLYDNFCSELVGDQFVICINDATYSFNETVFDFMLGTTKYTGQGNFTSAILEQEFAILWK